MVVELRQPAASWIAISKIYFKDAVNNTVKGFDAVHVLATQNGLELWLGEVLNRPSFSREGLNKSRRQNFYTIKSMRYDAPKLKSAT
ncbi:Hachiman antiphage defense system protein HamA [Chromobacterium amazonense]|uniref:Hachiman antiphage defense system protein HamA n=2 Tax=Chromobacterium amazonense TaxID=1382803 RepID=UPI0031F6F52C